MRGERVAGCAERPVGDRGDGERGDRGIEDHVHCRRGRIRGTEAPAGAQGRTRRERCDDEAGERGIQRGERPHPDAGTCCEHTDADDDLDDAK